jgi:hypothetical protein
MIDWPIRIQITAVIVCLSGKSIERFGGDIYWMRSVGSIDYTDVWFRTRPSYEDFICKNRLFVCVWEKCDQVLNLLRNENKSLVVCTWNRCCLLNWYLNCLERNAIWYDFHDVKTSHPLLLWRKPLVVANSNQLPMAMFGVWIYLAISATFRLRAPDLYIRFQPHQFILSLAEYSNRMHWHLYQIEIKYATRHSP